MSQEPSETFDYLTDLLPLPEELPADHRSGFVAVVGRPNVGKSTLINGWLGQKIAIVSPKAQTTRNRLLGILTRADAQAILVDTPGLHRPRHLLGEFMVEQAQETLADADVICLLVDASAPPTAADRLVAQTVQERAPGKPLVLALNKLDLLAPAEVQERLAAYQELTPYDDWVLLSALEPAGRADLLARIVKLLPFGPRYYPADQVTDQEERFLAAELIREQVLHATHQEVPHGVAVAVQEFKRRSEEMTYISATVYVEREAHKQIILGKDGHLIKQIGQAARRDIEAMAGTRVYLELWVKVWENWRKRADRLRLLGYTLPGETSQPQKRRSRKKSRS